LAAGGLDRINVQNNPVNFVDPLGLVSAGQLGIGNPGSYGGENTCESMYDERGPLKFADSIYKDLPPLTIAEIPTGPGKWVKWSKYADDIIGLTKRSVRRSLKGAAGKGKHQGMHGKWKSAAAKKLDSIAKDMEKRGALPEIVQRIRSAAQRLRQSAKGTNHGM
jgi:hypothetical protein